MKKLKRQLGLALMLIFSINLISINSNKIKSKEVDKIYGQVDNSNQDWSFLNYYYSNNFSEGNSIKQNFNSMNDSESISPVTPSTNSLMNSQNLENSEQSLSNSDSNFSGQDYNMQNFNYETKPISPTKIPKGFVTPKIESEYSTTQGIYGDTALVNNIRIGASRVPNSNSSTPGSSSTNSHVSYSALISDSTSQGNGNEEFKNLIYNSGNGNSVGGMSKNKSNSSISSSISGSGSGSIIKSNNKSDSTYMSYNYAKSENQYPLINSSTKPNGPLKANSGGNGNTYGKDFSGNGNGNGNSDYSSTSYSSSSSSSSSSPSYENSKTSTSSNLNFNFDKNLNEIKNLTNQSSEIKKLLNSHGVPDVKETNSVSKSEPSSTSSTSSTSSNKLENNIYGSQATTANASTSAYSSQNQQRRNRKNNKLRKEQEVEVQNGVKYIIRESPDKEFELSPDKINKIKKEFHEKKNKIEKMIKHLKEFDPKKSDLLTLELRRYTNLLKTNNNLALDKLRRFSQHIDFFLCPLKVELHDTE